ncbi:hypothetical protein CROQUDRAFT_9701, partial [Cronartium quercuum f. sp. fusiforme G11]
ATVSKARSIPSSPRSPTKLAKRQAYQSTAAFPLQPQSDSSGMAGSENSNETHSAGASNGDGTMMAGENPYQPASAQREVQYPPGLGDISALYNPGDTPATRQEAEMAPGANGNNRIANSSGSGFGSVGHTAQDLDGPFANVIKGPGMNRQVSGQGGVRPGVATPGESLNNGPMLSGVHRSAGQNPTEGHYQQPSDANLAPLLANNSLSAAVPSPVATLLPPVYSPLAAGNVNVTTVPASEKPDSSRELRTGLGGAYASNGTSIPNVNVSGTEDGSNLSTTEGSTSLTLLENNGNDTSHTQGNDTKDVASYT